MNLKSMMIWIAVSVSGMAIPLRANTLTPDSIASVITSRSPQTKAEVLSVRSLAESLKIEGNLPDPEIEGEYLVAPSGEKDRWGAGISWGIDWPGVYAARNKEASARVVAARAAVVSALNERKISVKRLLLDYVLASKQIEVLTAIGKANDMIRSLSDKAQKGGELTRLDINKLNLESANLKRNLSAANLSMSETISELNKIYGADCTPLLKDMVCEFPADDAPLPKVDIANSPAVGVARADAAAAKEAGKVAAMESLPGLSVGYQHAYEEGLHFNGATLGISIPLFSSRHKKKAAKAALGEALAKEEAALLETREEAGAAVKRIAIVRSQIADMKPVVDDPQNVELLMKALKGGVITLIDYLNERNYFTNAQLELLTLRHEAANLLLNLEGL